MNASINKSSILLALLLSLFFIAGLICGWVLEKGLYLAMNPEVTKAVTEGGFIDFHEGLPTSRETSDFELPGGVICNSPEEFAHNLLEECRP